MADFLARMNAHAIAIAADLTAPDSPYSGTVAHCVVMMAIIEQGDGTYLPVEFSEHLSPSVRHALATALAETPVEERMQ